MKETKELEIIPGCDWEGGRRTKITGRRKVKVQRGSILEWLLAWYRNLQESIQEQHYREDSEGILNLGWKRENHTRLEDDYHQDKWWML